MQITTVGDMRDARRVADDAARGTSGKRDPRIGTLMREGVVVFYVTLDGVHIESSADTLGALLVARDAQA